MLAVIDKERKIYTLGEGANKLEVSFDDAKNIGKFVEVECNLEGSSGIDKLALEGEMLQRIKEATGLKEGAFKQVFVGYVELYLLKHNREAYELGWFKV